MHNITKNNDVSLAKELQQHLSREHHKNGVIDQGKYTKIPNEIKWTDREYNVQDNADVAQKYVKMYCNITNSQHYHFVVQITNLMAWGGLSENYHLSFDTKIGNGICEVRRITCACVVCTSILDKPWISGIPLKKRTLSTCHQVHLFVSTGVIQQLEHHPIVTEINPS